MLLQWQTSDPYEVIVDIKRSYCVSREDTGNACGASV